MNPFMKPKLILSLCMILALSGCDYNTVTSTLPDQSVLPETLQNQSFDQHLDISIGYWDIEKMLNASHPDAITQYIESLFNVTFHPMSVTWSNYKDRYRILSSTHSLPDIFATLTLSSNDNHDSGSFINMIESNSIRALPEDMSSYPLLSNVLALTSFTKYKDGNYYAIPRNSFTDPILGSTDAAMLVRRDWMDTLDIKDPQSFDDFLSMTSAFVHDDPDGNGADDTIGYNVSNLTALGKWLILGISPECNTYAWISEDGQYIPSWTSDKFMEVVKSYRKLYQSDSLDPNFYSKSPQTVLEDFASGHLGALEYKSSPSALMELKERWDQQNDKPFETCVDVLPIFPASDGIRYSNSSNIFWSESYLSSSVSDEKAERILSILEFLLSENGKMLCKYGIENVDYALNDNGNYTCLIDTKGENLSIVLKKKYPSLMLFETLAGWGNDWKDFENSSLNNLRYGKPCVDLARKSVEWYRDNTTQLKRDYVFLNAPKESVESLNTSDAFQSFVKCIIGEDDPEQMWNQVLAEMDSKGLKNYISMQNEKYREQKE